MKFGMVVPPELGGSADPAWVGELARQAESLGFDEISVVEHSVVIRDTTSTYPYAPSGRSPLADDCPLPDPLELLAFVAGRTTRLGLATGVLVVPNHHPVVLAKRLATLDRLSAGRVRICVGVGWMREEVEACGGDFDRRGKTTDEAIEVMRELWRCTDACGASFHGSTYSFEGAHSWPKPMRESGVPLYVGGHSHAAARRAGRYGDGFQPLGVTGDDLTAALDVMCEEATRCGRDPAAIELVLGATLDRADGERVAKAEAKGASRLLLSARGASSLDQVVEQMTAFAQRVGLGS